MLKEVKLNHELEISHKPKIMAQDIKGIVAMRESVADLERRLRVLKAVLQPEEEKIISLIKQGAHSPKGFAISVAENARRAPRWKELFIEYTSKDLADQIIEQTEPSITRKLVIL